VELAKDGPQGDEIVSRLEVIEVGIDEDGEAITSCVIVPANARPDTKPRPKARITPAAQKVVAAFRRLIDDGRSHPAPLVPGVVIGMRAVAIADLRDMAIKLGVYPEPEPADADERKRWQNSKNKAYRDGLASAEGAGLLRQEDGFVWDPSSRTPMFADAA
jgi:hypothetical protein